ncbi:DUF4349 domain-containing protein [Erythrobacter mangrovi]|uniref:DUF4349 domain-containing protein n=1 Tax=Erythrobacter mangrovi TaxID=2739433 RepID=A0A7D4ATJ5_9SPHN|nr:DUF4349 domain-containing protein [Erythrobacter mangrovi]QKG71137.1 DUF4349 domain-containing protein [Erythrobacter mangrovi]
MKYTGFYPLLFFLLMSCSEPATQSPAKELIKQVEPRSSGAAPQNQFGFMEAMEQGPDLFGEATPRARMLAVNVATKDAASNESGVQSMKTAANQKIAYSYGYGFQIESGKIGELQSAHIAVCEAMGTNCRILRTSHASSDSWDGYGEIQLEVAATEAGDFGESLAQPAAALGGKLISSVRDGEDLSEHIIDSEARLQSQLILRQKLSSILERNRGTVSELVAAEKAVADVNEQIDAARSKLEQYRDRIQYSDVRIEYEPYFGQSQLGLGRPIITAVRSIGTTLGTTIAALIYLVTALVPVILLVLAVRWVLHRFDLRIRFWRTTPNTAESER